jgi:hypothetical protein
MITPISLQNLLDVMKMMAATEQLIADFYRTCAEMWEEDRSFWLPIVQDEEKHALNIEKMAGIIALKSERFEIGRPFNSMAIKTIMKGVESNLKNLREGRIDRNQIMIMARDIEASVMEKHYGEIVRTNDVEYMTLVKEITAETSNHKNRIDERIQALKTGGGS